MKIQIKATKEAAGALKEKLQAFRSKLLDNLLNIELTTHDSVEQVFFNELQYLQQILFDSKELEKLLGEKE